MANGRAPISGWVLAAMVTAALIMWFQPYSVFSPYRRYAELGRRFLGAALAKDTVELRRQAVSIQPVEWALAAADADPNALTVWTRSLRPYSGHRHGDTTTVVFQTSTRVCYLRPITLTFVERRGSPGLASASSSCFTER